MSNSVVDVAVIVVAVVGNIAQNIKLDTYDTVVAILFQQERLSM